MTTARILVVGVEPDLFDFGPFLSRTTSCHTLLCMGGTPSASAPNFFDLTIVYHPLQDMMLEEFNARMRDHDSASARSQLLVLSEGPRLEEAYEHARKGPNVVLSNLSWLRRWSLNSWVSLLGC